MAKPRPEKKSQKNRSTGGPVSRAPAEQLGLPMQLQAGDRIADETGEWEVIGRPYTTNAGKDAHAHVRKVGQPDVTEIRSWGAHERVSVRRVG